MLRLIGLRRGVGPQDLSVNWLRRYHTEFLNVRRRSSSHIWVKFVLQFRAQEDPVVAVDMGTVFIKMKRAGQPPELIMSVTKLVVETYMAHGQKRSYDNFEPLTAEMRKEVLSSEKLPYDFYLGWMPVLITA